MTKEKFLELLKNEVSSYKTFLETADNQWIVKGFVDVDKNVYTISNDTKVVSKIIEILLIPKLDAFARKNRLTLELPSKQNYYPDLTFKVKAIYLPSTSRQVTMKGIKQMDLPWGHIGDISDSETGL